MAHNRDYFLYPLKCCQLRSLKSIFKKKNCTVILYPNQPYNLYGCPFYVINVCISKKYVKWVGCLNMQYSWNRMQTILAWQFFCTCWDLCASVQPVCWPINPQEPSSGQIWEALWVAQFLFFFMVKLYLFNNTQVNYFHSFS